MLLQLEIPLETVAEGLREARRVGATCILDPAPARALPTEILQLVDIATPNETEACVLAGVQPSRLNPADAAALGNKIRELGVRAVVVKLGDQGCVYCGPDRTFASPALPCASGGFYSGGRHVQRRAGGGLGGRRGAGRRASICKCRGGDFGYSSWRSDVGAGEGRSGISADRCTLGWMAGKETAERLLDGPAYLEYPPRRPRGLHLWGARIRCHRPSRFSQRQPVGSPSL